MPHSDFNPYKAPLQDERLHSASTNRPWERFWLRVCSVLLCLDYIIGAGWAWFDEIESILVSGTVAVVLGLLLLYCALRVKASAAAWFSGGTLLFVAAVFLLINLNDWSPGDAKVPVSRLIVVATCFAVPLGIFGALTGGPKDDRRQSESADTTFLTDN